MRSRMVIVILASALFLVPSNSFSVLIPWSTDLDPDQVVPGQSTPVTGAMGSASGDIDTDTNELSWDINWSGLSQDAEAVHLHGPAAPGAIGDLQIDVGPISGLMSPSMGAMKIEEAQESDLLSGLWYIDITTRGKPEGEIGGQVNTVPEPSMFLLFGTGLFGLAALRRTS